MIMMFHWLRPWWLLCLVPILVLAWQYKKQYAEKNTWSQVCDAHLLSHLMTHQTVSRRPVSWWLLVMSGFFMIIGLAGPTWTRLPVPTYQPIQPRVVVLDLSDAMLQDDIAPNRLTRAKFKLHDLCQYQALGQLGLVVYTGEPFVVSPLTEDAQTIEALLSSLTPDIMPVEGHQLASALKEAHQLITGAGFSYGHILVMTASEPSRADRSAAHALSRAGIDVSVMPIVGRGVQNVSEFKALAQAGLGRLIPMTDGADDLETWLSLSRHHQAYVENKADDVPVWRDEGRWFLIPALFLLWPVFRRGWLL